MSHRFTITLLAGAIALSPIPFAATTVPAAAQVNVSVSFGYFHDALAPYGRWYHHPRWGDVWHPLRVEAGFRPYYRGHWANTDRYGWVWDADYVWGDIPFHYGRWVYDPYDGWFWIPGYVWAPSWVVWRAGGGYIGWFPMPPDDDFLAGYEVYRTNWNDWDNAFGYRNWYGPSYGPNWFVSFGVFVDERHFADRDYIRYVPPQNEFIRIVNNTRNVTNYVTVNNTIVNRSVDVGRIEKASGRRIQTVSAGEVIRNAPITPVNVGKQIQARETRQHGGDPKASPRARVASLPEGGVNATPRPEERVGNQRPAPRENNIERNPVGQERNLAGQERPSRNENARARAQAVPAPEERAPNRRRGIRPEEAAGRPAQPRENETRNEPRGRVSNERGPDRAAAIARAPNAPEANRRERAPSENGPPQAQREPGPPPAAEAARPEREARQANNQPGPGRQDNEKGGGRGKRE